MIALPGSGYVIAALFMTGMMTLVLRTLLFVFVRAPKGFPLFEFLDTTMPAGIMVALIVYIVFRRLGLSGEGGDLGAAWTMLVVLAVTIGLYWWWRGTVTLTFVGTALYMILANLVA